LISGNKIPTSFLPDEDQGFFYVNLQLPDAASLQRTDAVCRQIESILSQATGVRYTTTVAGFSLLSGVQSTYCGFFFVTLNPWEERKKLVEQYQAVKGKLNLELVPIPEGSAFAFSPPAIPGLGVAGGVTFVLEDRADRGASYLAKNVGAFVAAARERPELGRVITTLLPSVPQVYIDVDREKALKQGVALNDVYNTLQTFLGGSFINYFSRFGRQWQVYVQADNAFRTNAAQVGQFYVRNNNNDPVPLSSVTRIQKRFGPEFTMRFNLYRSAQIQVVPAPGFSSAQAMRALEQVFVHTIPRDMGYDYLGMSFQEKKAQQGIPPIAIFGFSLLFVFLILAALYESWSLPFSVLFEHARSGFRNFGRSLPAQKRGVRNSSASHGADRERRLCANWAGHDHRARGQERDFDRRVCEAGIRKGRSNRRCSSGRGKASSSPDPDDLAGLGRRLRATCAGFRPWSRGSPGDGNRRHRGNAHREQRGYLPDPRRILHCRTVLRVSQGKVRQSEAR
jgi:HAE1 family hydrophobic/amphiphilic exporter-1